jgi:hypothetical protein
MLETDFFHWVKTSKRLIVPNLVPQRIPRFRLEPPRHLVALGWSKEFSVKHLNRSTFPNVRKVTLLNAKQTVYDENEFPLWEKPTKKVCEEFWKPNEHLVQWKKGEWVNEEWIAQQYYELFKMN